jgi:DNA modification methylase
MIPDHAPASCGVPPAATDSRSCGVSAAAKQTADGDPADHGRDVAEGEGDPAASPGRRHPRNTLNDLTGTEWVKATKSWLICDSRRYHKNKATELHPARYPEELVAEFLRFFTKRDGWVLDPFCGSGATLIACHETERRGVGIEISERYAEVCARRIAELRPPERLFVVQADANTVAAPELYETVPVPRDEATGRPRFDFVITSPPYWNMLRHSRGGVESAQKKRAKKGLDTVYSEAAEDLGNTAEYDDFIEGLGRVFDGCAQAMRPGAYMVVVVQNLRTPGGEVKPLAWDLQRRISQALSFQGERIWCQNSKPLGIWGYPTVFVPNYHHHYCLIFRKPTA